MTDKKPSRDDIFYLRKNEKICLELIADKGGPICKQKYGLCDACVGDTPKEVIKLNKHSLCPYKTEIYFSFNLGNCQIYSRRCGYKKIK